MSIPVLQLPIVLTDSSNLVTNKDSGCDARSGEKTNSCFATVLDRNVKQGFAQNAGDSCDVVNSETVNHNKTSDTIGFHLLCNSEAGNQSGAQDAQTDLYYVDCESTLNDLHPELRFSLLNTSKSNAFLPYTLKTETDQLQSQEPVMMVDNDSYYQPIDSQNNLVIRDFILSPLSDKCVTVTPKQDGLVEENKVETIDVALELRDKISSSFGDIARKHVCEEFGNNLHINGMLHSCI